MCVFLIFRVVPISKTRNMHDIDLFMYFPILDLDKKNPNLLDQVSELRTQNYEMDILGTTPLGIMRNTIEIVFCLILCLAIYCLKRNQTSLENKLLKISPPEHQNLEIPSQNEIQRIELLYSNAQSFVFTEKHKNFATKPESKVQKGALFSIYPSNTFEPRQDSNKISGGGRYQIVGVSTQKSGGALYSDLPKKWGGTI